MRTEDEEEKGAPILVAKDQHAKAVFANFVSKKGYDEYAAKRTCANINWLSHQTIKIKSDQETQLRSYAERSKYEQEWKLSHINHPWENHRAMGEWSTPTEMFISRPE